MSEEPIRVIAWSWRYHSLDADEETSIDDAVALLYFGEGHGELSAVGIEVVGDRFYPMGAVRDMDAWKAHDAAEDAKFERWESEPKPTRLIEIMSPTDKHWARVKWCVGDEQAAQESARWTAALGEARVRIVHLTDGRVR